MKAMAIKNLKLKKREPGTFCWNFLVPVINGCYLRFIIGDITCDQPGGRPMCAAGEKPYLDDGTPTGCCTMAEVAGERIGNSLAKTFLLVLSVPGVFAMSQRFIIQTMVEEKENKMKETLRLSSLTPMNYAWSFWLSEAIQSLIAPIVFILMLWDMPNIFPSDTVGSLFVFALSVYMFCLATIPFAMTLSTFFKDHKIAS